MKLTRTVIADALVKWGIEHRQTPEAFELAEGWDLRGGSGIAGQNYEWFLWHARADRGARATGEKGGAPATTVRELRMLLDRFFPKKQDWQGTKYETRTCPRCRVSISAPASRMPQVFWLHEKRCVKATAEERSIFLKTRRWPKKEAA